MNWIPAFLLCLLGWSLFFYTVRTDPVQSVDCATLQYENDSLKEFLRTFTKSDSIKLED